MLDVTGKHKRLYLQPPLWRVYNNSTYYLYLFFGLGLRNKEGILQFIFVHRYLGFVFGLGVNDWIGRQIFLFLKMIRWKANPYYFLFGF
jgi:hypothetical protein